MTSLDVREMLDLPSSAGPRPTKKAKTVGRPSNLKGLQREVQSLGGDNPIAIVPVIPQFKKRRLVSRKPATKWEQKPFGNSARKDGLVLKHWRQKEETISGSTDAENGDDDLRQKGPVLDDSAFAKYDVQVNTPVYDDDQYESKLKNDDWSRNETDYLMSLVQDFDLRWPIIWDRYEYESPAQQSENVEGESQALISQPKIRSMEDLKARYYDVAATMMAIHHPVQYMTAAEFNVHSLMKSYNPEQERIRKRFAESSLARSAEDRKEEESLLIELKRIIARTEKLNEERKELYARLDSPQSSISQTALNLYTTSAGLSQLVQALMSADKSKKRKSLLPEGTSPAPVAGPSNVQQAPRESVDRRESIREPIAGNAGKKSAAAATPTERRPLTKDEEIMYGVSHHERLAGGPVFRHEKPTKMIHNKSAVLQQKILSVLENLDIPQRLQMPTSEVVTTFENLLGSVNLLLDIQKHADKLDGEIKLLEAQKRERERKAKGDKEGTPAPGDKFEVAESDTKREDEGEDTEMQDATASRHIDGDENGENVVASTRASSSGNKRSASVLSQASEQSSKRQRK